MKAVLLSRGTSVYGRSIYLAARQAGVPFAAVVLEHPEEWSLRARLRHHLRRGSLPSAFGRLLSRGARSFADRIGVKQKREPRGDLLLVGGIEILNLKELARRDGIAVHRVSDHNGTASVAILEELAPDVLVLGGTRIIESSVLATASRGTLNAHAGLLPRYRGMNVIEWAIFNGDAVGITVHFVDSGVDTGDVIGTREVPLEPGDDIQAVRDRAHRIQATALAEVLAALARGEDVSRSPQSRAEGKQYYRMTPEERRITEERLARRLQRSKDSCCSS